jgi:hypothetical protein
MRVETDHPDVALRALADRLCDRVRAGRRVLPDDDRNRTRIEHLVNLYFNSGLRAENVLDGCGVVRSGDRRIAEVDDLQVIEDVDIKLLHVAGIADRLLAHTLRTCEPQFLVDTAVRLAPARGERCTDDDDIGSDEILFR